MNSKKVFYVMIAVIVLLSGSIVGAVVMGDQYLKKQSDKLVNLKLETAVIDTQQTALVKAT